MPNIEHSTISDPNIHEPKGASGALTNTVYVSNGSGSGTWIKLPLAGLSSGAAPAGAALESDGSGGFQSAQRMRRITFNVGTLASVGANTTVEQTINVTGIVAANDEVIRIIKPTNQAGLAVGNVRVAADNQLIVQFINASATAVVPTPSEIYTAYIWRR